MSFIPFLDNLIKPVTDLIDNLHTSDEEKLAAKIQLDKIQHEAMQTAIQYETELIKAQRDIIVAEAKGSWMSKSWRPMLMFIIMAMMVNNFIIFPYTQDLSLGTMMVEFPDQLWDVIYASVSGYIGGRTGEKLVPAAIKAWKGTDGE